ncbi:7089_t:CDS:1, partial [Ambispora leptoticha]
IVKDAWNDELKYVLQFQQENLRTILEQLNHIMIHFYKKDLETR